MLETASCSRRFGDLRGIQWRIDLGILPSSSSASVDDLRLVTADCRRRYAALRRQLLVDPQVPKDGSSSPDPVMDNPLSQNPDSMWGRFFRNAELERMVDQDLTRLYPERGIYFQTSRCQGMLRRILLVWCLRHPEYGYRQGMHELLAPLLYVLQVDLDRLSEMRKIYNSHFADEFDGFSFHENDLSYKFDFKKFVESTNDRNQFDNCPLKDSSISKLDPEIQMIVSLTDVYGAEGELGIVLSEKFVEHDAYCMLNALMTGASGAVAMMKFFSPSVGDSHTGLPPVTEASAAIYYLLSIVDSSLHSHLVELGVQPQYFALRWLRVLFGREFTLEDLLIIWDEIFAQENMKSSTDVVAKPGSGVLESPRGVFIVAFAVSIILSLRSSLLATEIATTCLQRLLNFPGNAKLGNLLEKAKSLHSLAVEANISKSLPIHLETYDGRNPTIARENSLSLDATSPGTPLCMVPDSYWEQKWSVLHKESEHDQVQTQEKVPSRREVWSEKVQTRLYRTESDPTPSKQTKRTKIPRPYVRRNLLKDLVRQLGSDEDEEDALCDEDANCRDTVEIDVEDATDENNGSTLSDAVSKENVLASAIPAIPLHRHDNGNESKRNITMANGNDVESSVAISECCPHPVSDPHDGLTLECTESDDSVVKQMVGVKDRKLLSSMFQWMLKFRRNVSDGTSETSSAHADETTSIGGSDQPNVADISSDAGSENSCSNDKSDRVDHNLMGGLKNLGNSMLENIQVIESVFQQDRVQIGSLENLSKNGLMSKGQVTARTALKELRKISNLLSEM